MLLKSLLVLTLQCSCGLSMKLPEYGIYITTQSTIDEQEALKSGIQTDLVAPSPSSNSQYYQQPNYQSQHYFQQQAQINPFLYNGPLIMTINPYEPRNDKRETEVESTERSSQSQEESSFDSYSSFYGENSQFVDMLPPAQNQEEPNYYAMKPRKSKKYSASEEKKKYKKHNSGDLKAKIVKLNDYDDYEANQEANDYPLNADEIIVTPKVTNESESLRKQRDAKSHSDEAQDEEESASATSVEASETSVETSAPSSRLDFQMHGHKGPKTYKFGYDTGKGKNRQFKIEEKDEHGNVLGQYGYYEKNGKLRVVKYSSMANEGFKVL